MLATLAIVVLCLFVGFVAGAIFALIGLIRSLIKLL